MRGTPNDFFQLKTISTSKDWISKICCKLLALNLQVKPSPSFVVGDHLCFVGLKKHKRVQHLDCSSKVTGKDFIFWRSTLFCKGQKAVNRTCQKGGIPYLNKSTSSLASP